MASWPWHRVSAQTSSFNNNNDSKTCPSSGHARSFLCCNRNLPASPCTDVIHAQFVTRPSPSLLSILSSYRTVVIVPCCQSSLSLFASLRFRYPTEHFAPCRSFLASLSSSVVIVFVWPIDWAGHVGCQKHRLLCVCSPLGCRGSTRHASRVVGF